MKGHRRSRRAVPDGLASYAAFRSKREVEVLIARLHPQQPVPSVVRKPPELQVTISSAARERLRAIQDLMRHRLPSGDPAAIIERALEVLHAELLKKKAAEVARTSGVEFHHLQPYASAS